MATAPKKISTIDALLDDLGATKEFKSKVKTVIQERQLVNQLVLMRTHRERTQTDLAKEFGCSQGRISKIESGTDVSLPFSAVLDYIGALGYTMEVIFVPKETPAARRVKYYAAQIDLLLSKIASTADPSDSAICAGLRGFFKEAVLNLSNIISKHAVSYSRLGHPQMTVQVLDKQCEPLQQTNPVSDENTSNAPGEHHRALAATVS